MKPCIDRAEPRNDGTVALIWRDGSRSFVDLKPYIARGGRFALLAEPARFRDVHIGRNGRTLYWFDDEGDEIDFCADALREWAEPAQAFPLVGE